MNQYYKNQSCIKELFEIVLKIADQPTPRIKERTLYELYQNNAQQLIDCGALTKAPYLLDIDSIYENQMISIPVEFVDGHFRYFSPKCGWVVADEANLKVYNVSLNWLLRALLRGLGAGANHKYTAILDNFIWNLGYIHLKPLSIPTIVVRCIKKSEVYNALISYLDSQYSTTPVLVIALDNYLPPYFKLESPTVLIKIHDIIMHNGEDEFYLNTALIACKMDKYINKNSFSAGYRSAYIDGVNYVFSKLQAAALEEMDKANKPMHQEEITAIISPNSNNNKLISIFRSKKVHIQLGIIL